MTLFPVILCRAPIVTSTPNLVNFDHGKNSTLCAIRIVLRPSLKADTHRRHCSCHLADMCSDSELAPGRTVFPSRGTAEARVFPPDALPDANLFVALG